MSNSFFNFLDRSTDEQESTSEAEETGEQEDGDWSEINWDDETTRSELAALFDEEADESPDETDDTFEAIFDEKGDEEESDDADAAAVRRALAAQEGPSPEGEATDERRKEASTVSVTEETSSEEPDPEAATDLEAVQRAISAQMEESPSDAPSSSSEAASDSLSDRPPAEHSFTEGTPNETPLQNGNARAEPTAGQESRAEAGGSTSSGTGSIGAAEGLRERIENDKVLSAVLKAGLVTPEQLQRALKRSEHQPDVALWRLLADVAEVDRERVFEHAARAQGFERVTVDDDHPTDAFLETLQGLLPEGTGRALADQGLLPIELAMDPEVGNLRLVLATHDPAHVSHQEFAHQLKIPTALRYASEVVVQNRLARLRDKVASSAEATEEEAVSGPSEMRDGEAQGGTGRFEGSATEEPAEEERGIPPSPDALADSESRRADHAGTRASEFDDASASFEEQRETGRNGVYPSDLDEEESEGQSTFAVGQMGEQAPQAESDPTPDTITDADQRSDADDLPDSFSDGNSSRSFPSPEESLSPDDLSNAFRENVFSDLDPEVAEKITRARDDVVSKIFDDDADEAEKSSTEAPAWKDRSDTEMPNNGQGGLENETNVSTNGALEHPPAGRKAEEQEGREEEEDQLDQEAIRELKSKDRVVSALLKRSIVTVDQVHQAQQRKEKKGLSDALWRVLAQVSDVDRQAVYAEAARVYAFPLADLERHVPDPEFTRSVMEKFTDTQQERLLELGVIPLRAKQEGDRGTVKLFLITHDPMRPEVHRLTRQLALDRLELQYAPEAAVADLIQEAFPRKNEYLERIERRDNSVDLGQNYDDSSELIDEEELEAEINRSTLINLFEATLVEAVREGASDIHIYPNADKKVEIHFRIDGRLTHWHTEEKVHPEALLSVIKDNSMNVDRFERDAAQDGFIQRWVDNALIRFRVSVMPIANASQEIRSESIVIRVLDDRKVITDLGKLGLLEGALERFEHAISQPHGMVILTGPTGSGKSTTLVAALHRVISPEVNVLTIEDPVEYIIPDVRQIKLNDKLKLQDALRSILRHDPDVVMVGEMRDRATAELAIKLANTGHLTFSTLHTNDAPSAVSRLYKMDIEPFLIAYAINLVVAQRLIRKLCPDCKRVDEDPDYVMLEQLGFTEEEIRSTTFFKEGNNRDCKTCRGVGYKGRRAISEALYFSRPIRHMIVQAEGMVDEGEIREQAMSEGMLTLRDSAREVVKMGQTSIREMMRVVASEGKTLA